MDTKDNQLHIFFFPFFANGHMLPMIDMAKLFSSHSVKATIVTTPLNSILISKSIQRTKSTHVQIDIQIIDFPSPQRSGLPENCENVHSLPSPALIPTFLKSIAFLQQPLEQLLVEHNPDCLIADMFFPWANEVSAKFNIPRLIFHGGGFFSLCASHCVRLYEPHKRVSSDFEPFIIPNLPEEIMLTRMQLSEEVRNGVETELSEFINRVMKSETECYGAVVNSFYELEKDYADYYRSEMGRKAWHIGPLSLCNKENEEKGFRGKKASVEEHECLKWLDSKQLNSVVYVCFGSVARFTPSQLKEIAKGLEASGQQFIWVVREKMGEGMKTEEEGDEDWLPEGFEQRMLTQGKEKKGLIIRGWAPQLLILGHGSVGGFVTHCGWNSTLEGISAGVPMVTWPVAAEQFYNEKLITQVLKVGVGAGVKKWVRVVGDSVTSEAVEAAVRRVMVGEEAEEMRRRAKKLAEAARKAVGDGGSSFSDLNALIRELKSLRM